MNIIDRLNLFLEQFGVSKSQFADSCEIPRPTASQILSGRNKKISDDIIGKIHLIYPDLSISWLMFGEGNMLIDGATIEIPKASENSIFENESNNPAEIFQEKEQNLRTSTNKELSDKQITKIVVFYSDNSFEEFYKK